MTKTEQASFLRKCGDDEPWALPASELSGKKRPDGRAAAGAMMGMGPRGARR